MSEVIPTLTAVFWPERLVTDYNYVLFDALLFVDAHRQLDNAGIPYYLVSSPVFKIKEVTPTLIALGELDARQKQVLYDEFVTVEGTLGAHSRFDQMSLCQNFIKSNKSLGEMQSFIKWNLDFRQGDSLDAFRFYDARVAIHLSALIDSRIESKNSNDNVWRNRWAKHVTDWVVSIAGGHYHIDFPLKKPQNEFVAITFEEIDKINDSLRTLLTPQWDGDGEPLPPLTELPFEQIFTLEYKKLEHS